MREWIVTNGLGGYASLNYSNYNDRKFHGLLVASLNPPTERWIFVSNVYDFLKIEDDFLNLNNCKGNFSYGLFPTISYDINGVKIKKTFLMPNGKNTTIIKYDIETKKPKTLIHSPVINSRHFYDVTQKDSIKFNQEILENKVHVKPNNVDKTLKIILNDSEYTKDEYWSEYQYRKDQERNDSWIEHSYHIGKFSKLIKNNMEYYIVLSIEDKVENNGSKVYLNEIKRRKKLVDNADLPKKFHKLILSSDNFIVKKRNSKSIIAGYHWFGDWGRDTLISLPGLTLVTKRYDIAREILLGMKNYTKNGLIPNAFMDRNSEAVYNTVDASLWYIDRVFQYLKYTNDCVLLEMIWDTLKSIIEGYKNGTDFGIHMDTDFLISHDPGLTWMDVKLGDYFPTPRARKAVEIQALWYNALRVMSVLSEISGKEDNYSSLAESVKENFKNQFDQRYDVIDTKDTSIRPNQIFLVSLDFSMVDKNIQERIVEVTQDKLQTVFGLRTLSPDDSSYIGDYIGEHNRDVAYHNGTVWTWPLGSFIKAFVKVKNHGHEWQEFSYKNFLKPMLDIFGDKWDGSINEIFDGNPPYIPRGCITQAWSVAEILRAWVEDIEGITPEYEKNYQLSKISV